ncbi:hypothetical protein EJ110_NYTH30580 [Nymphaea thermarum]|nr:hypothetical protein EJ110_NYTH30580 [Nymphaea thermarum]
MEAGDWTITSVLHDATAVAGSGAGGMLSAIHGLNQGMLPYIRNGVKGPMWLHLVLGLPPILLYSAAGAVLGGYALPRFAQCSVTSYYAASSASHDAISQLTRRVEGVGSGTQHKKPT